MGRCHHRHEKSVSELLLLIQKLLAYRVRQSVPYICLPFSEKLLGILT